MGQSRPCDDLQETSAFAPTAEVRVMVGYRRFVPSPDERRRSRYLPEAVIAACRGVKRFACFWVPAE